MVAHTCQPSICETVMQEDCPKFKVRLGHIVEGHPQLHSETLSPKDKEINLALLTHLDFHGFNIVEEFILYQCS